MLYEVITLADARRAEEDLECVVALTDGVPTGGFHSDLTLILRTRITSYNVCYTKLLRWPTCAPP